MCYHGEIINKKGGFGMSKRCEVYRCAVCGAVVEVVRGGGGTLYCCGQPMERMEEHAKDVGVEKHLPVVEKVEGGYRVKVGQVPHPMLDEHHIEWIELLTLQGVQRQLLPAAGKPEVVFQTEERPIAARAFCNLHGLWRSEW